MELAELNWGSVADWASAFGSIFAAGVALYLAGASQRVQLSVVCGVRVVVGNGTNSAHLASILVTNVGDRPVRVSGISLRHGLLKKKHGIIKIGAATEYCESLLRTLVDGDQAHFGFQLNSDRNWVASIGREIRNKLDLETLRVTIHCSNGQSVTVKPERPLLDFIHKGMKEKHFKSDAEKIE